MLLAHCCTTQRALGFRVTLKHRILRRSWPMTKKQYRTPNVSVGNVKKSIAAIAWRGFRRNASQRLAGSETLGALFTQRETFLSDRPNPRLRRSRWIRGPP